LETLQSTDVVKSLAGLENLDSQLAVSFIDVEPEGDTGASFAGLENLMPPTSSLTAPSSGASQNQGTMQNPQGISGSSTQNDGNSSTGNQQNE